MTIREEMAEYLGPNNWQPGALAHNDVKMAEVMRGYASLAAFQDSKDGLHHWAWRELQDWWLPMVSFAAEYTPAHATLLDYHAATGWVGLRVPGRAVAFADYQTRCSDFLRWRLERRGLEAEFCDLNSGEPERADAVVCIGALGAYPPDAQWDFVQKLAGLGDVVALGLDRRYRGWPLCYPVDAGGLLGQIRETYPVRAERVLHDGNVYMVAFDAPPVEQKRGRRARARPAEKETEE